MFDKLIEKITFGSDPEFFIEDGNNNCIPPVFFREEGLTPIKDDSKHPVYFKDEKITIIEDGAAFEMTVPPTNYENLDKLFKNINYGLVVTQQIIASKFGNDFKVSVKPTINFNSNMFGELAYTKKFEMAVRFGCDPDLDAFDESFIARTIDVKNHKFRYGGGHIHFGTNDKEMQKLFLNYPIPLIKLLAIFVGNSHVIYSDQHELDKLRTFYYGKPGKFRVQKPYGVEYRTPSNSWIINKNAKKLFYNSLYAIKAFLKPELAISLIEKFADGIKSPTAQAIINQNTELALNVLEEAKIIVEEF